MKPSFQSPGNPLTFSIRHFQTLPDIPVFGLFVAVRYVHNSFHHRVLRNSLSATCNTAERGAELDPHRFPAPNWLKIRAPRSRLRTPSFKCPSSRSATNCLNSFVPLPMLVSAA